jgi:hypothetical protein
MIGKIWSCVNSFSILPKTSLKNNSILIKNKLIISLAKYSKWKVRLSSQMISKCKKIHIR